MAFVSYVWCKFTKKQAVTFIFPSLFLVLCKNDSNFVRQTENYTAMKPNYDTAQEKNDNTILFSKVVKAGKRIYYVDVKRDRLSLIHI